MNRSEDSARLDEEARKRLPLKQILTQFGHGPHRPGESWKGFECPFCQARKKAGIVEKGGKEWFNCFAPTCPSKLVPVKNEVGVLAMLQNVDRKEAWISWIKMAGLWREERAPSIMPGQSARKVPLPEMPPQNPEPAEAIEEPSPFDWGGEFSESGASAPEDLSQTHAQAAPSERNSAQGSAADNPSAASDPDALEVGAPARGETQGEAEASSSDSIPSGIEVPSGKANQSRDEEGASGAGEDSPASEAPKADLEPKAADADGEPPGDDAGGDSDDANRPSPLKAFWERTGLEETHFQEIRSRRGLSAERILTMGPRSSVRGNREVLEKLAGEFEAAELVACGLWARASETSGKPARPNALYYGLGNTGKKSSDGKMVRDWIQPVLIPYWHWKGDGRIVYLRPHKDAPSAISSHLYVPKGQTVEPGSTAVITEGEWKAEALADVLPAGFAVAAVPGISMVRDDSPGAYEILSELWAWTRAIGAKRCVVVFDNEDKGQRVPDKRKRYDTEVWARYLAILAGKRDMVGLVGRLPDEWREGTTVVDGKTVGGKADWDSALAMFRRLGRTSAQIRDEFVAVLRRAVPPNRQAELGGLDAEAEAIVRAAVAKKFYRPKLSHGGPREEKISKRLLLCLQRMGGDKARNGEVAKVSFVRELANAYRETSGRYYVMKNGLSDKTREWWMAKLHSAQKAENTDAQYVAQRVLEGVPSPKSDFVMQPLYMVNRVDGKVHRRVKLRSVHKEERVVNLGPEIHSPVKFREACISMGGFSWDGNENDLAALRNDTNCALAGKTVNETAAFGWNPGASMWVYDDAAIVKDGSLVETDGDRIVWLDGVGYIISDTDQDGEEFRAGRPHMRPTMGLRLNADGSYSLAAGDDDPRAIADLANNTAIAIHNAVGGCDGMLAIGSALAFAVGPEFFRKHQWFPGLWLTGAKGSGKSTLARMLSRFFGFDRDSGINLKTSTVAGLLTAFQQYHFLPVWLDDFRHDLDDKLIDVLRSLYNRESGTKVQFSSRRRLVYSNAIVVGEHTARDSATRQRYVHVHLAEEKRIQNHIDWMEASMDYLFTIGRHVLRNRQRFSELFWEAYEEWCTAEDTQKMQERSRTVHGVAMAGAMAFIRLFGLDASTWVPMTRRAALAIAVAGDETVRAEANVAVFFHEMATGFTRGIFSEEDGGIRRYFKVRKTGEENDGVRGWSHYELMFDLASVHAILRENLRRQGRTIPIEIPDLVQQMSAQSYYRGRTRQRLCNGSTSPTYLVAVDLESHPMGRRQCSADEMAEAMKAAQQEAQERIDRMAHDGPAGIIPGRDTRDRFEERAFADPRKGELFLIVDAVLSEEARDAKDA